MLRLERPSAPGEPAAARLSATLNGQRLPDPAPSAVCLGADGRLTLSALRLVPGGVPTEFMNLLLGEPLPLASAGEAPAPLEPAPAEQGAEVQDLEDLAPEDP